MPPSISERLVQPCSHGKEEKIILEYIKHNPNKFQNISEEESIIKAIDELEILLCNYLKTSEIEEYLMLLAGMIQNEA